MAGVPVGPSRPFVRLGPDDSSRPSWTQVFPWNPLGPGICRSLDDAGLWHQVFHTDTALGEKLALALRNAHVHLRTPSLGERVIAVLASTGARRELWQLLGGSDDFLGAAVDGIVWHELDAMGRSLAQSASGVRAREERADHESAKGISSRAAPRPAVRQDLSVGRNDPCPCGSGKKYKKCHGHDKGDSGAFTLRPSDRRMEVADLTSWLATHSPLPEGALGPVARIVAAYSMLQPDVSAHLGLELVRADSRFTPLLDGSVAIRDVRKVLDTEPTVVSRSEQVPDDAHDAQDVPNATAPGEPIDRGGPVAAIVQAVMSVAGPEAPTALRPAISPRPMSIARLRDEVKALELQLEASRAQLRSYEETRRSVERGWDECWRLPWIVGTRHATPFDASELEGGTIEAALERLGTLERDLGRVRRANLRLESLQAELERTEEPFVRPERATPASIAGELEQRCSELEATAARLRAREARVVELRDQLIAAGPGAAVQTIQAFEPRWWVEVGDFMAASEPLLLSESGQGTLRGHWDLLGLTLGYLAFVDKEQLSELASRIAQTEAIRSAHWRHTLAFLSFGHVQQLAVQRHELAQAAAELFCAVAVSRGSTEALAYLEGITFSSLDRSTERFLEALLAAFRRGETSDAAMLFSVAAPAQQGHRDDPARRKLLDRIKTPDPGMEFLHKRLRSLAHARYLRPLEVLVEQSRAAEALDAWREGGTVDEKVASILRIHEHDRGLKGQHEITLRRYVAGTDDLLVQWATRARVPRTASKNPIAAELTELLDLARRRPESSAGALVSAIARAQHTPLPLWFGERWVRSGGSIPLEMDADPLINATMLLSWPQFIELQEVDAAALLADSYRTAFGVAPSTVGEAVDHYIAQGLFDAAVHAAGSSEDLRTRVVEAQESRRRTFREARAELLQEAERARPNDPFIDMGLTYLNSALDRLDFEAATAGYGELIELLEAYRLRSDPAYQAVSEFLVEAGHEVDADAVLSDLEDLAREVRAERAPEREHIVALSELRAAAELPESVRSWASLAERYDRPSLWLSPERSKGLAGDVRAIVQGCRSKLCWREEAPETVDALVAAIEVWVPTQLRAGLESKDDRALGVLHTLAERMARNAPDILLFKTLDAAPKSGAFVKPKAAENRPVEAKATDAASRPRARDDAAPATISDAPRSSAQSPLPDLIKRLVTRARQRAVPNGPSGLAELREATRRQDWSLVAELATNAVAQSSDPESQPDELALVALATARLEPAPDENRDACLAAIAAKNLQYYLADPKSVVATIVASTLSGLSGGAGDTLPGALEAVAESNHGAAAYRWLQDLFSAARFVQVRSGSGSGWLAQLLWDALKGAKKGAPRADLLQVLFRMRRDEALRELTTTAKPHEDLVRGCLTAFLAAESDPMGMRAQAVQLASALRAQTVGKPGTGPWNLLFQRLSVPPSADHDVAPLAVTPADDFVDRGRVGDVPFEVVLRPSGFDPPERLDVEIGIVPNVWRASLLAEGEYLFKERTVVVHIPHAGLERDGDLVRVPYRFTGQTCRGRDLDVRGTWELQARTSVFTPLTEAERREYWPGTGGNPVTGAFFLGRQLEVQKLERLLRSSDRPHSAMLIGQRRIGKTSLLLHLAASMPPSAGNIGAAFVDVAGLRLSPDRPIATSLFDYLVDRVLGSPDNAVFRDEARLAPKLRLEPRRFVKGVDPERSGIAGALEFLVDRLREESGGRISRVALFLDEFDRFIEPLWTGRADEVKQLMWGLREIVQRSPNVALVLAGSGLQRLLIQDYEHALYKSVEVIELEPFSLERDREAIEQTFMPRALKDRLCAKGKAGEVARFACDLAGGHPYFLAMLGYEAALANRLVTRALVAHVAERLVIGDRRDVFYKAIFESLLRLNPRSRAVAHLLLTLVAERSTAEHEWVAVTSLLQELQGGGLGEREIFASIKDLVNEGALVHDQKLARLRIRVPLTAGALREDGREIQRTARTELQEKGS